MICKNLNVNSEGHLTFAGFDTVSLAQKYGSPLYLVDEDRVREMCRTYIDAMLQSFGCGSHPHYASKALSFSGIYRIMKEEGMGIDVVSAGEIASALKAGFPMEHAYFHGNAKTDAEIEYAMKSGVGIFVVDNSDELKRVGEIARELGKSQRILLRLTPGIDPHTYAAVNTGKVDSKFGTAIETGQALEIVKDALSTEGVALSGFHCHIGSQIFDITPFADGADVMLAFCKDVKEKLGYEPEILDLGGGFGVRYVESDPVIDIAQCIRELAAHIKNKASELGIKLPAICMEPGRSIVADAGLTLYTVQTIKNITGFKSYVAIDGGMTDNPRFALYGSKYTVVLANKASENADRVYTVAGRCCESGDLIAEDVKLPGATRGDILAVMTTGAYNYSMASNYNRVPRPPIVMLSASKGKDYVAVRRETLEDITQWDVL